MATDGHGTTITFATSAFAMKLIDVNGPGMSRAAIDATTMASDSAMEFIPAALYDGGEVSLTVEHDAGADVPIDGAAESIEIDWAGGGDTYAFTGFMTDYEPSAQIGDRMTATCTLKVTGAITGPVA